MRPGQRCDGALVAALTPATPVDYLELRLDYYPPRSNTREVVHAGTVGTPCATAKDRSKCASALAAAIPPKSGVGEYLVYTRGDEVKTVSGREAVPFLAPIDGPEEAAIALVLSMAEGSSAAIDLPTCDPAKYRRTPDGFATDHLVVLQCDERHERTYVVGRDGAAKTSRDVTTPPKPNCESPFLGRRPEGLTLSYVEGVGGPTGPGQHFAECTEMEAASVRAFQRLASELRALGAPSTLGRRARRAASEERRHARVMRSLARRFGASPGRPRIAPFGPREAVDVAIENAVHGCVFETWAALVATWQAVHATDAGVGEAMVTIARDETRHAALARDVAEWLEPRLTASERDLVAEARRRALAELASRVEASPAPELTTVCGLPTAACARVLLRELFLRDGSAGS